MARGAGEVFKDVGFIFKLIELILIIVLAIVFFVVFDCFLAPTLYFHLASFGCYACFWYFFPVLMMMVIYIMEEFPDKKYELILGIVGAVMAGLAGVFFICSYYAEQYGEAHWDYTLKYGSFKSGGCGSDNLPTEGEDYIIIGVVELLLMVAFLLDAVLNGAGIIKS